MAEEKNDPLTLHHYFHAGIGPFRNLSDLPPEEAERVQQRIRAEGTGYASKRSPDYLDIRRDLERRARELFQAKGGKPVREHPHDMTLGACPWLREWYPASGELCMHLEEFDPGTVSFTYGDLFPTFRVSDGKPYRGQVYTLEDILEIIRRYGMPQNWNPGGRLGPERYIEAQIWDDAPLRRRGFL